MDSASSSPIFSATSVFSDNLYETAVMSGDFATYLIRSLLSEGYLRYETVEKTSEGLRPRPIEREGPTSLVATTTTVKLRPATRHGSLASR